MTNGAFFFTFSLLINATLVSVGASDPTPAQQPKAGKKNPPVAFVNVSIVPMDAERVVEQQTVIVRDGRIAEIGSAEKVVVPGDAQRIDGRGKYLMPGLVDMHAHLNSPHEFPLYLANGVTTVYNLNGRPAHLLWRDSIRRGDMSGPTIYTCGPTIRLAEKADEARRIVEEQSKAGYDSIKIYVRISKEAHAALMETARQHHMLTVGHIPRAGGLEAVLKERQPIAHAEEYVYTFFHDNVTDEKRIPQAVAATRAADVPVILTLVAFDHIIQQAENLPAFLARPENAYLAPWVKESWGPKTNPYAKAFATRQRQQYLRKSLNLQKSLVKAMHQAGVRILVGTDAMNPGSVPGFTVHEELRNLLEIGCTPFDALQAATAHPAEFFTKPPEFGTLDVGKRADLLLVEANPLRDLDCVAHPAGVMTRGAWFTGAELKTMLDGVPAAYAKEEQFVNANVERDIDRVLQYLDQNDPFDNLASQLAFDLVDAQGITRYRKLYEELKRTRPAAPLLEEAAVNKLGYRLLQADKRKEAIEVFRLNIEFHPKSANAYDSLAEAHLGAGEKELALQNCKKALELDPLLASSRRMLQKLTAPTGDGQ